MVETRYLLRVILLLTVALLLPLHVLGNPHRHGHKPLFDLTVDPIEPYESYGAPEYGLAQDNHYEDYGLLPGEVDTYRNILMDIMDILDEQPEQQTQQRTTQKRKKKNKKKKGKRKGRKCRGKKCRNDHREQALVSQEDKQHEDMIVVIVEGNEDNPLDVSLASLIYYPPDMWSRCTRSCITRRFRKCKFPELCSKKKLQEEAFCYAPGSTCEQKVQLLLQDDGYIIVDEEQLDIGQDHDTNIGEGEDEMDQGEDPLDYDQQDFDYEESVDYNQPSEEESIEANDNGEHINSSEEQTSDYYDENLNNHNEDNQEWVPGDYDNYVYYETVEENKPVGFDYDYIFIVPDDFVEYDENHVDHPEEDYDYSWSDWITGGQIDYDYDTHAIEDENIIYRVEEEKPEMPSEYAHNEEIDQELAAQCGKSSVRSRSNFLRIIGGKEAIVGEFPWQVAVLNRFKEVFCGGVVIAPQWILTAAHCIRKKLYVRLAEHDIRDYEGRELEIKVHKMFKHPDYDLETIENDIALLKLPKKVQLGQHIRQICLPAQAAPPPIGNKCIIAGWGKERESHIFGSDVLNYAKVPIVSRKVCRAAYPDHPITRNHVCAGYKKGNIDSCAGDSGGPLLCKGEDELWTVHGVTSFGEGCGETGKFGVYTKVANYIHWIRKTMKENIT